MTARDLLELAQATGVEVLTENGKLVLRGDESAIASLVPEAKAHKTELLDELTRLPEDLVRCIERVAAFHGFTRAELREAKRDRRWRCRKRSHLFPCTKRRDRKIFERPANSASTNACPTAGRRR